MMWDKKMFWLLIACIFFAVFVFTYRVFGVSYTQALMAAAGVSGIYIVCRVVWRELRLYRVLEWISLHSPLKKLPKIMAIIIITAVVTASLYVLALVIIRHMSQPPDAPKLTYTKFVAKAEKHEIGDFVVLNYEAKLFQPTVIVFFTDLADGKNKWAYFPNAPAYIPQVTPEEWLRLQEYDVDPKYPFSMPFLLFQTLQGFIMSIPMFVFLWFIAGGGMRSMMQEWGTIRKAQMRRHPPIYFEEIGGLENAKKGAEELIAFLKNPGVAKDFGARMPTGVLLSGPTGSGKTMFATAIATEAGVPLFHISGSDFRKPLVGLGSDTVKHLFDLAKRNTPCIVFIDEFDSAVPVRGSGSPLSGNEGDAITNTMLSEVDDINKNRLAILVIGATNLLSKVDDAAKRPGRFDRPLIIQYPDEKGRAKIIKIQLSADPTPLGVSVINNDDPKNPIEEYSPVPPGFVDELVSELAKITAGFSGAALNTLNNEARVMAFRKKAIDGLRKDTFIAREDFYEALPSALTRSQQSDRFRDEHELDVIGWHEGSHTYFSYLCKGAEPTKYAFLEQHASIGGMAVHGGDNEMPSESKLNASNWVTLAGYVIEKARFGEVTTGPSSDLRNLTLRARAMKHDWGMGKQGPIAIDVLEGQAGDNTYARIRGPISQAAQKEAQEMIVNAEAAMLKLLENRGEGSHYAKIGALAAALREKHMLREAEIKEIIGDIEQIEVTA